MLDNLQPFDDSQFEDGAEASVKAQGFGDKVSFGKLTFTGTQYQRWDEKTGTFRPISQSEYRADQKGAKVKYQVNVDIKEWKPDLQFTYDRTLDVGSTDWNKTFLPSLVEVSGKDAVYDEKGKEDKARVSQTLKKLNGSYVCVADVPQQPRKGDKHMNMQKDPPEPYRTMKLVAVYAGKAECEAAYIAKFGASGGASDGNGLVDANETWNAIKTEKDYIESLRGGVASTKAKPLQVKKVKDTSLEWGLTEADYAAHAEEIMQLAGIAA